MMSDYICAKKVCHGVLKKYKILHKELKWFLTFMNFAIFTRHCDSIQLDYVCESCEGFDNYHITKGFF